MKRSLLMLIIAGCFSASLFVRADDTSSTAGDTNVQGLSPEHLDMLDKWGCFTPAFKTAVHELVDSKQATAVAKTEEESLTQALPNLKKQAEDAEARVGQLHEELESYDHGADTDFVTLQKMVKDPNARLQDELVQAQAYIWGYPSSPHQSEAQQDLQDIQKKLADQLQAQKDAEAARAAAQAKLLQRVQARDLSLAEWRNFLRDLSQDDLLKYLGRPQYQGNDYWVYTGDWTTDQATQQKVGLQINFNAGRVNSVSVVPH